MRCTRLPAAKRSTDPAESNFFLESVRAKAPQLLALIRQIKANPQTFQAAVEQRVGLFTPLGVDIHLDGYIVAAGDSGGYAFGATDFYLNIGIIDELVVAKGVTTHELYHAVQGAIAKGLLRRWRTSLFCPTRILQLGLEAYFI